MTEFTSLNEILEDDIFPDNKIPREHHAVLIKIPLPHVPLVCFYMCIVTVNENELAYDTLEMCTDIAA